VVGRFIDQHGADIAQFVRTAWQLIGEIVNTALTLINEVVTRVLGAVKQFIDQHGTEIQTILGAAWRMIKSLIEIALNLIKGILQTALAIIRGDWELAWTTIKTTAETIWESIKTYIGGAIDYVEGLVRLFVSTIIQFFVNLYNRLVGGSIVPDMVDAILLWFRKMRDKALEAVGALLNQAIGLFNDLKSRVLDILGELVSGMYERGAGMVRAFAQGIMDRLHELLDAARRLAQEIRDLLPGSDAKTGPLSDLTASGASLPATLAAAINHGVPVAVSAVETLAGGISDLLTMDTAALGAEAGLNWIEAMIKAITSRLPALGEAAGQALGTLSGGGNRLDGAPSSTRPSEPARGGPVTINLNGPWHVSGEMDAAKIAEIIGEVLAGRAQTNRRLAVGWAGVG